MEEVKETIQPEPWWKRWLRNVGLGLLVVAALAAVAFRSVMGIRESKKRGG
jgi:hypothetical protein